MNRYYAHAIKLYVCFVFLELEYFKVMLFRHSTGVMLFEITLPVPTGKPYCGYINNKDYPWLYDFLIANNIAKPTNRRLCIDDFYYYEFRFNKEEK